LVTALVDWLKAPDQTALRRSFAVWINRVLLPNRLPGVRIEETQELQEVETMLAERVAEWTAKWKEEGLLEGLEKGLERGLEKGRQEGLQEGLQEGRQEGYIEMLLRLLERKFPGRLDKEHRRLVKEAGVETLLQWTERILTAETIEEVFD